MTRPHKTGPAHQPKTAGDAVAVFHFEWIVAGCTAKSFWTAPRRLIAALEDQVGLGSRLTPPGPIESE